MAELEQELQPDRYISISFDYEQAGRVRRCRATPLIEEPTSPAAEVDEDVLAMYLYAPDMPDPDLRDPDVRPKPDLQLPLWQLATTPSSPTSTHCGPTSARKTSRKRAKGRRRGEEGRRR